MEYGISGDVELTDKTEMHRTFSSKNLKEKDHLEDLGLDRRRILRLILNKWDVRVSTVRTWLGIWTR